MRGGETCATVMGKDGGRVACLVCRWLACAEHRGQSRQQPSQLPRPQLGHRCASPSWLGPVPLPRSSRLLAGKGLALSKSIR